MAGVDLIIEKFIFFVSMTVLIGLTLYKLNTIMHKGERSTFQTTVITWITSLLVYMIGFMLFMTMPEELGIHAIWFIFPLILGINTLCFLIEIILLIVTATKNQGRQRFKPLGEIKVK